MMKSNYDTKMNFSHLKKVVVIGAGFTGLSAAYELSKLGIKVIILEKDSSIGGLAGSFEVNGVALEKFYHHWFVNDFYVVNLIKELKKTDQIVYRKTRTGMYYSGNFFKLSSPIDLLKFKSISFLSRIRLGILVLYARRIKNWKKLEKLTAKEWLIKIAGKEVYTVVWEPLLYGKFGSFHSEISAVWFWNKLKLRGGSRNKQGSEELAYYKGGFSALAELITSTIQKLGGEIRVNTKVESLIVKEGRVIGVRSGSETIYADAVIATTPLPVIVELIRPYVSLDYLQDLQQIDYLANVCLVLELDRSLSTTYWLNINDSSFPFVGIIEHTNFESKETYGGRYIVYLSKYLSEDSDLWQMNKDEYLNYAIPFIQAMFSDFNRSWILDFHLWKASYSQPVIVRHYSKLIPSKKTPIEGLYIATMAQIYPEDRGTNYAIREGKEVATLVLNNLKDN